MRTPTLGNADELFDDIPKAKPAPVANPADDLFDDLAPKPHVSGPAELTALADSIARKHGVDPDLFKRLVHQESGWNPRAVSKVGAQGLGQLMPGTAKGLGVTDPFDPEQNLDGSARYLRQQLDSFGGDQAKALAAYNAGPGRVRRYGGVPPIKETQDYVNRILGRFGGKEEHPRSDTIANTGIAGNGQIIPMAKVRDVPRRKTTIDERIEANLRALPHGAKGMVDEAGNPIPTGKAPDVPDVLAPDHPAVLAEKAKNLPFDLSIFDAMVKRKGGKIETNLPNPELAQHGNPLIQGIAGAAVPIIGYLNDRKIREESEGKSQFQTLSALDAAKQVAAAFGIDPKYAANLLDTRSKAYQKVRAAIKAGGGGTNVKPDAFAMARTAGATVPAAAIVKNDPGIGEATISGMAGRAFLGAMAPSKFIRIAQGDRRSEEEVGAVEQVGSGILDVALFGGISGLGAAASKGAVAGAVRELVGKTAAVRIAQGAVDSASQRLVSKGLADGMKRLAGTTLGKAGSRALAMTYENTALQAVPIWGQASDLTAQNGKPFLDNLRETGGEAAKGLVRMMDPRTLLDPKAQPYEKTQAAIMQGLFLFGAGVKGYEWARVKAEANQVDPAIVAHIIAAGKAEAANRGAGQGERPSAPQRIPLVGEDGTATGAGTPKMQASGTVEGGAALATDRRHLPLAHELGGRNLPDNSEPRRIPYVEAGEAPSPLMPDGSPLVRNEADAARLAAMREEFGHEAGTHRYIEDRDGARPEKPVEIVTGREMSRADHEALTRKLDRLKKDRESLDELPQVPPDVRERMIRAIDPEDPRIEDPFGDHYDDDFASTAYHVLFGEAPPRDPQGDLSHVSLDRLKRALEGERTESFTKEDRARLDAFSDDAGDVDHLAVSLGLKDEPGVRRSDIKVGSNPETRLSAGDDIIAAYKVPGKGMKYFRPDPRTSISFIGMDNVTPALAREITEFALARESDNYYVRRSELVKRKSTGIKPNFLLLSEMIEKEAGTSWRDPGFEAWHQVKVPRKILSEFVLDRLARRSKALEVLKSIAPDISEQGIRDVIERYARGEEDLDGNRIGGGEEAGRSERTAHDAEDSGGSGARRPSSPRDPERKRLDQEIADAEAKLSRARVVDYDPPKLARRDDHLPGAGKVIVTAEPELHAVDLVGPDGRPINEGERPQLLGPKGEPVVEEQKPPRKSKAEPLSPKARGVDAKRERVAQRAAKPKPGQDADTPAPYAPLDPAAPEAVAAAEQASKNPLKTELAWKGSDREAARGFATEWIRKQREAGARFDTPAIGRKVGISKDGMKKMTRSRLLSLRMVPLIEEMLGSAVLVKAEANRKGSDKNQFVHRLVTRLETDEGNFDVWMLVKEASDGSMLYDHQYTEVRPVGLEDNGPGRESASGIRPSRATSDNTPKDGEGGEMASRAVSTAITMEPEQLRQRLSDITKLARSGGSTVFSDLKRLGVRGLFENPSRKWRTGRIRMDGGLSPEQTAETLAHEVAHQLDSILRTEEARMAAHKAGEADPRPQGAAGDIKTLFGVTDKAEASKIDTEMKAVTEALVGAAAVEENPEYYHAPQELWARLMQSAMFHPTMAGELAPTTMAALVKMSKENPRLGEFMAIAQGEMLDAPNPSGFFHRLLRTAGEVLNDRRQGYERKLGKYLGTRAWEEEVTYRARRAKAIEDVRNLAAEKFKDVHDDPVLLFTAAEGVLRTTGGVPEFGTRIFADAPGDDLLAAEAYRAAGYDYVGEAEDGSTLWSTWRVEPHAAEIAYNSLSDAGKNLIQEYTADAAEAKTVFSREKMASVYGIDQTKEGWVHHFGFEGRTVDKGVRTSLKEKTASARRQRKEADGFVKNLQLAIEKSVSEAEIEKQFNEFLSRQVALVAEPLESGQKARKGWVEVRGTAKTGFRLVGQEAQIVTESGSRVLIGKRFEVPAEVAERYIRNAEFHDEVAWTVKAVHSINRYWQANILLHPGSAMTNMISGGLQLSTKVMIDFYGDILRGDVAMPRTKANVMGLLETLTPGGWKGAPEWIYGGEKSGFFAQFSHEKVEANAIDKVYDKGLAGYQFVETFWKKAIVNMEKRQLKPERLDDPEFLGHVNNVIDLYAFDYQNVPVWLEGWKNSAFGSAVKPFLTYPYKYGKHLSTLTGRVFDPTVSRQDRLATLLGLATVAAAYELLKHSHQGQTVGKSTTGEPLSDEEANLKGVVNPRGRPFVGKDGKGKEVFVRTAKYPVLNAVDAIEALVRRDPKAVFEILKDQAGTIGPIGNAALLGMGYNDEYGQYKPGDVKLAEVESSFLPAGRILEDTAEALDPKARAIPKTPGQVFGAIVPVGGGPLREKLAGPERTVKVPLYPGEGGGQKTTVEQPVPKVQSDILWREFGGIIVKRIDPDWYRRFQIRAKVNAANRAKKGKP